MTIPFPLSGPDRTPRRKVTLSAVVPLFSRFALIAGISVSTLALAGCHQCPDCARIHDLQKKQLDYLPTPKKRDTTIWTGADPIENRIFDTGNADSGSDLIENPIGPDPSRIRRATVQLVIPPTEWIEPETFDADGSWTI